MVTLIFGGLNINNKECPTFTSIYLAITQKRYAKTNNS